MSKRKMGAANRLVAGHSVEERNELFLNALVHVRQLYRGKSCLAKVVDVCTRNYLGNLPSVDRRSHEMRQPLGLSAGSGSKHTTKGSESCVIVMVSYCCLSDYLGTTARHGKNYVST